MYNPAVLCAFNETISWLAEWACSRSFGLGTRVPWDDKFLIESLSDSTIYMAYYTIAHLLQGGDITGQTVGPAGLSPAQCTDELFDHVFLAKPAPPGLPADVLARMVREFRFWYPLDLRVSGKDLINNHLTMALYNHAAVWEGQPELWPRSMFTNGHVLVDGRKMSKSEGNFLTLHDAITRYSADAARFACADAGDGNEDANFSLETVDMAIKKLVKELDWMRALLADGGASEADAAAATADGAFAERWFANEMVRLGIQATRCYERMAFRDALKYGFHEFQEARDKYGPSAARAACAARPRLTRRRVRTCCTAGRYRLLSAAPSKPLLVRFVRWQALLLAPICPHYGEAVWELLHESGCIVHARWPDLSAGASALLEQQGAYVARATREMRADLDRKAGAGGKPGAKAQDAAGARKAAAAVRIYVAREAPAWKLLTVSVLKQHYDDETRELRTSAMQALGQVAELRARGKHPAVFAATLRAELKEKGAAAFELAPPFDEVAVLRENEAYICTALDVSAIHVLTDESTAVPDPKALEAAAPLKPVPVFLDERGDVAFAQPAAAAAAATGKGGGGKGSGGDAGGARKAAAGGGGGGGKANAAGGGKGGDPEPPPPAAAAAAAVGGAPKVASGGGKQAAPAAKLAAKDYVEKHALAQVLHEAVNAVVLAQPAEPLAFIAQHLLAHVAVHAPAPHGAAGEAGVQVAVGGGKGKGGKAAADSASARQVCGAALRHEARAARRARPYSRARARSSPYSPSPYSRVEFGRARASVQPRSHPLAGSAHRCAHRACVQLSDAPSRRPVGHSRRAALPRRCVARSPTRTHPRPRTARVQRRSALLPRRAARRPSILPVLQT